MLSKAQVKYIKSLSLQKFRKEHRQFIVEGDKIVTEWLQTDETVKTIIAVDSWIEANHHLLVKNKGIEVVAVDDDRLKSVSGLQTPNKVIAVVNFPKEPTDLPFEDWIIVLENLQDPGNMGTIIRIADWFGIKHIVCSKECVDVYNPKVIQAAMGSHLRLHFYTADLHAYLQKLHIPILAATLHGKNLHQFQPFDKAVLMIGNESKGLSETLISLATNQITIPRKGGAESLNAAVATGILCAALTPQ